ncbi:UDP:flavonoid glycosyltransferase YjiC, YdhE family, partial [Streptomyces sp. DvalAA-14]|uniref:glycosyltransferase n=1 Tax=unclassified Streptomyces TaxID=2593676 RepID=UPI00081B2E77
MNILFEPIGGALGIGAITRCLAMAQAAAMRGHRVAVLAPDGYPLVDDLAYAGRYTAPFPVRTADDVGRGEADGFTEAMLVRGMGRAEYAEAALAAELRAYRDFAADIVVTEMQPTVPIAAHLAGIPFACTVQSPNLTHFAAPSARPADCRKVADTYGELCERHGLARPPHLEDLLHQRAAVNIAPTAEVLEPALAQLPNTAYVGPVLLPALELAPGAEYSPGAARRILVYLSFGAVTLEEFLPELAAAFPAPHNSVVVAAREADVAGRQVPFTQGHITVARTPGITNLLQRTDLMITRGGQNALMAALLAGVPVIGTPGRSPEPLFNLASLAAHNAAVTLTGRPTAAGLAEAADRLEQRQARRHAAALGS